MPDNWFSLSRLFDFRGRASRREYFLFHLIAFAAILLPFFLFAPALDTHESTVVTIDTGPPSILGLVVGTVYFAIELSIMVGLIAVAVRRLHDQGKPWWHMLFGFIPLVGWIITLVWIFTPGDEGENEYGPDPRDGSIARTASYDGVFD